MSVTTPQNLVFQIYLMGGKYAQVLHFLYDYVHVQLH